MTVVGHREPGVSGTRDRGVPSAGAARRARDSDPLRGWLMALQRAAGNAAVSDLLASKASAPARRAAVQRCGPVPCDCSDGEREQHGDVSGTKPTVMRIAEGDFRTQLGSTGEQRVAIDALFANPTFAALMSYLRSCTATPKQDVGPLRLKVTPGLKAGGTERFGGYNPVTRTLEINPTKREHVSNPSELVDTIVHELIHAVDDLQPDCVAAGSGPAPLAGGGTAHAPSRADVAGTPEEARLMQEQGPGASDPCGEFIDINDAAQRMIVSVIQNDIAVSGVGRPTLTFVNTIIRDDPAAMAAFEGCRKSACSLPVAARNAAVGNCAAETIAKFIPPALQSALIPTRVRFEFNSHAIRAGDAETINLVALFLKAHPADKVNLVGHTDSKGSVDVNLKVGLQRANSVKSLLLAKGVPPAQIDSVTSVGAAGQISTKAADQFLDRRVEITL